MVCVWGGGVQRGSVFDDVNNNILPMTGEISSLSHEMHCMQQLERTDPNLRSLANATFFAHGGGHQ